MKNTLLKILLLFNACQFYAQEDSIMITLSMKKIWFDQVKNGHKMVLGRLNNDEVENIQVDTILKLVNSTDDEIIVCRVTAAHWYATFAEMLHEEGLLNLMPEVTTIEEGVRIYESFAGYAKEVERCGCIALHIRKEI